MVLNQNHSDSTLPYLTDPAIELVNFFRVHPACRFIKQRQRRLCRERSSELKPPLFAEGKIASQLVALVSKIEEVERSVDLLARALRAVEPTRQKILLALLARILSNPKVLPDGQLSEQPDVLESPGDAQRHTRMARQFGYVDAAETHAPRGQWNKTANEVDDCTLTRTVGAD